MERNRVTLRKLVFPIHGDENYSREMQDMAEELDMFQSLSGLNKIPLAVLDKFGKHKSDLRNHMFFEGTSFEKQRENHLSAILKMKKLSGEVLGFKPEEKEGMLPTGHMALDPKTAKYKEIVDGFCDGITCDCCGGKIEFNISRETLCKNCNNELQKRFVIDKFKKLTFKERPPMARIP